MAVLWVILCKVVSYGIGCAGRESLVKVSEGVRSGRWSGRRQVGSVERRQSGRWSGLLRGWLASRCLFPLWSWLVD